MKHFIYLLMPLAIFSCKPKNTKKSEAEKQAIYMKRALASDMYKDACMNVQRINLALDSIKKGVLDSNVAIFEYNNSMVDHTSQVKTLAQVEKGMKNDTAYLKATLSQAVHDMALADSAGNH